MSLLMLFQRKKKGTGTQPIVMIKKVSLLEMLLQYTLL
mgnify:CR=1 FL=1